jgi:hypothetical protein
MQAWEQVARGQPNPLPELVGADEHILRYLPAEEVRSLLDATIYVGDAPERARALAGEIRTVSGPPPTQPQIV